MSESKTKVSVSFPIFWIFIACLGYFVYGGVEGAIATFVLGVALSISMVLGIIPFVGPFLWWGVSRWIMASLFAVAGIGPTLLSVAIWWFCLLCVCVINFIIDAMVADAWW